MKTIIGIYPLLLGNKFTRLRVLLCKEKNFRGNTRAKIDFEKRLVGLNEYARSKRITDNKMVFSSI